MQAAFRKRKTKIEKTDFQPSGLLQDKTSH